jgi:hypothetical protein
VSSVSIFGHDPLFFTSAGWCRDAHNPTEWTNRDDGASGAKSSATPGCPHGMSRRWCCAAPSRLLLISQSKLQSHASTLDASSSKSMNSRCRLRGRSSATPPAQRAPSPLGHLAPYSYTLEQFLVTEPIRVLCAVTLRAHVSPWAHVLHCCCVSCK